MTSTGYWDFLPCESRSGVFCGLSAFNSWKVLINKNISYILYSGRLADNSSKGGKGLRGVSVLCLGLDFCVARSEWNFCCKGLRGIRVFCFGSYFLCHVIKWNFGSVKANRASCGRCGAQRNSLMKEQPFQPVFKILLRNKMKLLPIW
jgi:hypothetical protein